ncbi:MAG: hydantoinase/oxoprolinase family protein [Euryarchaeota archaeon]|nr:hydantoinase/oxoprolinase family protein [Euryarchaeota archaeon]
MQSCDNVILSTDVGGTFIDFVEYDGKLRAYKKLRSEDIRSDIDVRDVDEFHHGTTVGINALLERRGRDVVLITTRGFGTLYRIGRQSRRALYSLLPEKEHLPIKRVIEVNERTLHDGKVLQRVNEEEIIKIAKSLSGERVAVCLLNSYANPENEERVKEILMRHGVEPHISAEVRREIREYERLSTTVIESYIYPILRDYLAELSHIAPKFYVMQSNGGKMAKEYLKGVNTLMSGPAGGIAAAEYFSRLLSLDNVITYDMGGTSADIGAIVNGTPLYTSQIEVDGIPIRTTSMDIITIGAGGGSIAWLDDALGLHVGPKSAGAVPGPACYARGGSEFTVTDANLLLGVLGEEISGVSLNKKLAMQAAETIGKIIGVAPMEVAEGVRKIVDTNMSMAIKKISISRGYDPRNFTLFAYGGAGPMHACSLASEVGIKRIVVPPMPGAFSSLGVLMAPVRYDYSLTLYLPFQRARERIEAERERFRHVAEERLGEFEMHVSVEMRYRGQGHEIEVPFAEDSVARFEELHRAMFGFTMDEEIYVIDARFVATQRREINLPKIEARENDIAKWRKFRGEKVPVYRAIKSCEGPCIVELGTSTVLVEEGWEAQQGEYGEILMEVSQ